MFFDFVVIVDDIEWGFNFSGFIFCYCWWVGDGVIEWGGFKFCVGFLSDVVDIYVDINNCYLDIKFEDL